MSKAREFYIWTTITDRMKRKIPLYYARPLENGKKTQARWVVRDETRVIEHSAFESLQKENTKLKAQLEVAVEALKDIRKYSLGTKADVCDEALQKIVELGRKDE